jgi:hypothetical protein
MGTFKAIIGIFFVAMFVLTSCTTTAGDRHQAGERPQGGVAEQDPQTIIDTTGKTIFTRFSPPPGFTRTVLDTSSFGFYLRHLTLKPFGTRVKYYDGQTKNKHNVYISVIDMDIGNRDLQQCADAVMRLRSEYLYARQRYLDIHFNFVSDGQPRYYEEFNEGDHSYGKFRKYLDFVFSYANTSSLSQELISLDSIGKMQIGDVLIQKGNPYGHAVIVIDMAENPGTREKVYMLAQSYMPAQDIQVLVNRNNFKISPWYILSEDHIETPEWNFRPENLKRFGD